MMANPEKGTLNGTSMNNGAPANAGAPDGRAASVAGSNGAKATGAQGARAAEAIAYEESAEAAAAAQDYKSAQAKVQAGAGAGPNAGAGTGAKGAQAAEAIAFEEDAEAAAAAADYKGAQAAAEGGKAADADAALADEAMAKAAAELTEWKDKYVRLHAEWDTYRRRIAEQREEEKARAAEKLVTSLLPVLDDLERTIDYAEKNGEQGLIGGVQAVLAKFVDILQKDGVQVIDPKGEAFDALEEQAVGTVEDASQPDETVAEVYQKGYKMGSKVLRPAMVTVTSGGPKRPKEE